MSFLRILSPARRTNSHQREEPTLVLKVADYGFVYLTRTYQPFGPDDLDPGYASEPFSIRGSLQISIPIGHGRCRCKSIRVALRSTCRLAMGPSRGWEEDVIFEREEKIEDADGIWLDEGLTKFEFAFALPNNFHAMDMHENAVIRQEMHATVEGIPSRTQGSRFLQSLRASSPSAGPSRDGSPSSSRRQSPRPSRSPSPVMGGSPLRFDDAPITFSSTAASHLPQAPAYEEATAEMDGDQLWLEGTYTAKRNVRVIWNPNPTGGSNSLDTRVQDTADGLGDYEVHFQAPLWTTSCILHTRIHFPHIPSTVTIFHTRVELVQTVFIRSPREKGPDAEAKAIRTTRRHLICSEGKRPSRHDLRPDVWKNPAMDEGGTGEFQLILKGRLPNDDVIRPSTLEGIHTPIHVSHHLAVELVYSIWNQDRTGAPLAKPGPGAQRTLSIARSVILPGCTLIPDRVNLPEYASVSKARLTLPNQPCPLCHMLPDDRFCTTCRYELPLHPRHDHPPKLVGSADGVCPVCSALEIRDGNKHWHNCACAMSGDEIQRLSESILRAGGGATGTRWEAEDTGRKEEYERGRQMDR